MAVVGAAASAIMATAAKVASVAVSAIAAEPLAAAGLGIGGYTAIESTRQAEKAREAVKKRAGQELEFMEKQAGEYYQLSGQQMELQAQAASIKTLANLITARRSAAAAPQVFTLPAAKEYSAVDQINQAIDKMLRG